MEAAPPHPPHQLATLVAPATSHVDQINPSPSPSEAVLSPDSASTLLAPAPVITSAPAASPNEELPLEPTSSRPLLQLAPVQAIHAGEIESPLPSAHSDTTAATDEHFQSTENGDTTSAPPSENGGHVGHGSEEGGMEPFVIANGRKVDVGRRRSGTGLDMPVPEQRIVPNELDAVSTSKTDITSTALPPAPALVALVAPNTPPLSSVFLPSANVTPPRSSPISRPHVRSQSMASPRRSSYNGQSTDTTPPSTRAFDGSQSSSRRPSPSTSRDPAGLDVSESPRRRTSASGEMGRSPREKRESEERKKEREKEREATRSRRVLGEWVMGKTLGAGSMGKVKLGISSVTSEKVAIKIVPRYTSTAAAYRPRPPSSSTKPSANGASAPVETTAEVRSSPKQDRSSPKPDVAREKEKIAPSPSDLAKAAAKDASKEVRTIREASLCMLLHHPYVCGMKSMILYPNHYYMVFDYVNGGQMLDYIISHGRLRERSARKFARQIGSALQYCHANSIVHRDLKIENILISKTGNIKIIDFGLSNLYSLTSHLSTFCGSLYFAAPELLNAKPYTGPEVDVWSFGIVLYVLVCGKVPFDDQSMPALHAKIKRGQVEYPAWLSAECKHLLSRMLVTSPLQRATLVEVLSHPWIIKGFTGPPADHVPSRTPLRFEEIEFEIIKGMVGFEFGTEQEIHHQLLEVLDSEHYRKTIQAWEARKSGPGIDGEFEERTTERPSTRVDGKDMKGGVGRPPTNKRFSGLGFYGKKLAGGFNAAFAGSSTTKPSEEVSEGDRSVTKARQDAVVDPTRGFHPLISIYFLVYEKREREKIYGAGVFASSTLSLNGPPPPPAPISAYQSGSGVVAPVVADKPLTTLAAAAAAHAAAVHDGPTPPPPSTITSPRLMMTPQPRQRATAEDFAPHASTAPPAQRDFDKRSSFHPASTTASTPLPQSFRASASYEPLSPSPRDRRSLHIASPTVEDRATVGLDDTPLATPSSFARRFGSLLGRSSPSPDGDGKRSRQRASIAGSAHKAGNKTALSALPQVEEAEPGTPAAGPDVPLASPANGKTVKRASTIGELSPSRHQRSESMGVGPAKAATLSRSSGSTIMERQLSTGLPERLQTAGMLSESVQAPSEAPQSHPQELGFVGRTASVSGSGFDTAKPVYLKGLFSVATTSTKSIARIREDIIRVLDRLAVQHRDVKSGFECYHSPSIHLSSVQSPRLGTGDKDTLSGRGTLRKKSSKLGLLAGQKDLPTAPRSAGSQSSFGVPVAAGTTSSTSFTVFPLVSPTVEDPAVIASVRPASLAPSPALGATTNEDTAASELVVRFEIFIVKMPFLPGIHGLQFRRIGGNAWQYQMLARRILQELKL